MDSAGDGMGLQASISGQYRVCSRALIQAAKSSLVAQEAAATAGKGYKYTRLHLGMWTSTSRWESGPSSAPQSGPLHGDWGGRRREAWRSPVQTLVHCLLGGRTGPRLVRPASTSGSYTSDSPFKYQGIAQLHRPRHSSSSPTRSGPSSRRHKLPHVSTSEQPAPPRQPQAPKAKAKARARAHHGRRRRQRRHHLPRPRHHRRPPGQGHPRASRERRHGGDACCRRLRVATPTTTAASRRGCPTARPRPRARSLSTPSTTYWAPSPGPRAGPCASTSRATLARPTPSSPRLSSSSAWNRASTTTCHCC